MKCIAYVSRVVSRQNGVMVPTGLMEIYRVARNTNAKYEITGAFSFCKGHYIQVFEGPDAAVDQLYINIQNDNRHEAVTMICQFPVAERSFSGWSMKLLKAVSKDKKFRLFIDRYSHVISSLPKEKADLLNLFFEPGDFVTKRVVSSYEGKELKLLTWPDFTVVKQSPVIIELSARLIRAPQRYDDLLDSGYFGVKQQLDAILDSFDNLDILSITDGEMSGISTEQDPIDGFYTKMRNFLGLLGR